MKNSKLQFFTVKHLYLYMPHSTLRVSNQSQKSHFFDVEKKKKNKYFRNLFTMLLHFLKKKMQKNVFLPLI